MATLYKPVPIETAEQAEALPVGTLATAGHIPRIARKSRPVQWDSTGGSFGNRDMTGWTALVPTDLVPTDAEVGAAACALAAESEDFEEWDSLSYRAQEEFLADARLALNAAREVRP